MRSGSGRSCLIFFGGRWMDPFEDSPLLVAERVAEDQFRTWLKLWPACSTRMGPSSARQEPRTGGPQTGSYRRLSQSPTSQLSRLAESDQFKLGLVDRNPGGGQRA